MFKMPPVDRLTVFDEMYNKLRIPQNFKLNNILSNHIAYKQMGIVELQQLQLQQEQQEQEEKQLENKISSDPSLYTIYLILKKKEKKKEIIKSQVGKKNFFFSHNKKIIKNRHVIKTVLDSIKYKFVKGIRIEAAGRLTRRYTASRSLFKKVYLGNIRNMDSSFKKLSTVILRGHSKSNLQYTKLNSKKRIGSYGIKG